MIVEVKREDLVVGDEYLDTDLPFLRNRLVFLGFEGDLPYFSCKSDYYNKDEKDRVLFLMPIYKEVENE